jgi:proteasome lid subunit RPN8/RPN11
MTFSSRRIIQALVAPRHKLACHPGLWAPAVSELVRRGQGRRESGAFVLGHIAGTRRQATRFVYYDDLDPHCLDHGIVTFDGSGFAKLWKICRELRLDVVADVHTHEHVARQSPTDRQNPMMAHAGHIAVILPNFARGQLHNRDIGVYVYKGSFAWEDHYGSPDALYRGLWA